MTDFNYLQFNNQSFFITRKQSFHPLGIISNDIVKKVIDFSYDMTFGKNGEHRSYRTGGSYKRKNGEIFSNTFQGKLAEFSLYNYCQKISLSSNEPDMNTYQLGKWDSEDLIIENKSISIKSTKSFGNLLLLEKNDWDEKGNYLPNNKAYDYIFLIRMKPFCEDIMKKNRILYSQDISKDFLLDILLTEKWTYDIPGFITLEDLKMIIQKNYIIEKGSILNERTTLDASNYYVQSGDLRSIDSFIKPSNT